MTYQLHNPYECHQSLGQALCSQWSTPRLPSWFPPHNLLENNLRILFYDQWL